MEHLYRIEEVSSSQGENTITLESSLNAVKFYEKCGYKRKKAGKYQFKNGAELEVVIYEKEINS